ncbi:unnamed protein product [Orchesella dallaii]|uniref:Diaminopimelate decarboxylase n=1 Tax=Orchesella dallaii TaxID=48710 RepID=A0ABP1PY96_9HEXA
MAGVSSNDKISPFSFRNGSLYCENIEIDKLFDDSIPNDRQWVPAGPFAVYTFDDPITPAYVYSAAGIKQNVKSYVDGLRHANLNAKIGYAIKANPNIWLVEKMKESGVGMIIAVSGYEVLLALKAGFTGEDILLNGNGKQPWEIKMAIDLGVLLNVDSVFDAQQIARVHQDIESSNEVKVLLRIRPVPAKDEESKLKTHEYVNTAENSKFGFEFSELDQVLAALNSREKIKVVGVHCHFGSCLTNPKVYEWLGTTVTDITTELDKRGIAVKIFNVGGGVGIDYHNIPKGLPKQVEEEIKTVGNFTERFKDIEPVSSISDFLLALAKTIPKDCELILEPGRSLIGNAGILVCKNLGTKVSYGKKFLVVDGSMNEVIRPCLYGSHHQVFPTKINVTEKWTTYDVVGPVCESADFLAKNVPMQTSSTYMAVMDCGAYCSSMASRYNMRPQVTEILVDDGLWRKIRRRDTFEECYLKYYDDVKRYDN